MTAPSPIMSSTVSESLSGRRESPEAELQGSVVSSIQGERGIMLLLSVPGRPVRMFARYGTALECMSIHWVSCYLSGHWIVDEDEIVTPIPFAVY